MNADRFASAVTDMWHLLSPYVPGSRLLRGNGVAAVITRLATPAYNAVWLERPNPSAPAVAALIDQMADEGVPFTLFLRPGSDLALADLAAARGMKPCDALPLMVRGATAVPETARRPFGLTVRVLAPHEASVHARLAAATFGIADELMLPGADILRADGVRCYVGETDLRPVATAIGVTVGEFTGIFSVATDPGYRRRGFGTAITAQATSDGMLAGATWCWLQATEAGYPVYRRLGFQAIETWTRWISGD